MLPPTRFPVARTRPGYATLPRRRGWDSNPRWLITTPLFESGTFNHSDTSPTAKYTNAARVTAPEWRKRQQNRPAVTGRRVSGTPGRIRTCGLWVRNPTLYPLSYRRVSLILHQIGSDPPSAGHLGREGRDSNPRSAFSALNRLAGGPIRPLWHLPRWLCPRLANGVACTGFQTEKFTTGPARSRDSAARQAGVRPHHEVDPPPRWPCLRGAHRVAAPASGGGTRSRDACS